VGIFCFVYTATGIFAVTTLQHDKRKMAWVISLLNSFVLTFSAGSYFLMHIPSFIKDGRSAFHTVNDVSALIAIWLCLANIYDLLFGLIFYRKYLDPLTAYVHHTLYVWITLVSVFGTDGVYQYEPFAGGLAALLVEELPTLLLALGSVFPSMRTDLGFGVTFLMFRVLFHAAMMTYSVYSGVSTLVTVLYSITMTMHLFWFVSWARKYGVKAVKKDKTVSAADDKKSS
jgi:hypothetical protein